MNLYTKTSQNGYFYYFLCFTSKSMPNLMVKYIIRFTNFIAFWKIFISHHFLIYFMSTPRMNVSIYRFWNLEYDKCICENISIFAAANFFFLRFARTQFIRIEYSWRLILPTKWNEKQQQQQKKTDKRNESHTFHSHQRAKGIYTFFSNRSVQIWCVSTIVYRAVCLNFFSAFFFSYLLRFKSNVSYKSICHCMWPRLNQSHHTTYHAYNTKTENDFNFE